MDVGLTVLLVTADGQVVEHPRHYHTAERHLKHAQQQRGHATSRGVSAAPRLAGKGCPELEVVLSNRSDQLAAGAAERNRDPIGVCPTGCQEGTNSTSACLRPGSMAR